MTKDNKKSSSAAIITAQKKLAPFLQRHRHSTLEEIEVVDDKKKNKEKRIIIQSPWGDKSLMFFLPKKIDSIANILNSVYLPEQFTAIYHKDSEDLEIIYTAYKRSDELKEIEQREFHFSFNSKDYLCEFSRSSDRLLKLAEMHRPVAESQTEYRNLRSFLMYTIIKQESEGADSSLFSSIGEPISFWIRNVEWNEDKVLQLVLHLNLYMHYFDTESPLILLHSPKTDIEECNPPVRFRVGNFPKKISARNIDTHLLHYWDASLEGDSSRRFSYSYRIIEYIAFSHLEAETRSNIRKTLAAPNALDNLEEAIDDIVNILGTVKQNFERNKIESFLVERIDSSILWKEISKNEDVFKREVKLDGNFTLRALLKPGWNEQIFEGNGIPHFASIIREIRNGLSHGKEQNRLSVITPTQVNFQHLEPWAMLIKVVAQELLIYKGVNIVREKPKKKEKELEA